MVSARLGCVDGRAILVADSLDKYIDIEKFSGGKLPSEPMACIEVWSEVCSLATSLALAKATDFVTLDSNKLECPVPRPRQIFAIGINYKAHAAEMNHGLPKEPLVFTKFPSSLNSPFGQINLTGEKCDYEAELVAIIAKPGRNISVADAWSHVAGLCVGQDFSDRELQYANTPPQFSLGKSRAGFTAIGPWITDAATLSTRANLEMTCRVSGEVMQNTQTDDMIFEVPDIVSYLSGICELYAGDVIYTGTPSGVGAGRTPQRFLRSGDIVETTIQDLGTLINICK
jgi:2-keto-4-pentenoate hydratase/2-oxohepta-3-ene-1,7-dioic acid hydratase in catechol pathway